MRVMPIAFHKAIPYLISILLSGACIFLFVRLRSAEKELEIVKWRINKSGVVLEDLENRIEDVQSAVSETSERIDDAEDRVDDLENQTITITTHY